MNVLAIDHHFGFDLQALIDAAQGHHEVRILPADYFGWEARRYFPEKVWSGLREYHRPEYRAARDAWRDRARAILHELYMLFPFEAIIAPADTFFYIRDFRTAAKELGVPFLVVLKETTVPQIQMERDAREVKELFPFVSDYCCVCSERTKQFWILTGAPPDLIEVTGQPRFDFYRQAGGRPLTWQELGYAVPVENKKILFLSYDPGIFQSEEDYLAGKKPWGEMRQQTEDALVEAAKSGRCAVLIKPHPQQPPDDVQAMVARLRERAGDSWNRSIFLVDPAADARPLVAASDVIVGFQTTTLLEAMIAGKETIYTQWGALTSTAEYGLLPYDQYDGALTVARDAGSLKAILAGPALFYCDAALMRRRQQLFETLLGRLDGHASERVWSAVERVSRAYVASEGSTTLRRHLSARRGTYLRRHAARARFAATCWGAVSGVLRMVGLRSREPNATWKLERRRVRQMNRYRECIESLRGDRQTRTLITGSVDEGIERRARALFRRFREFDIH